MRKVSNFAPELMAGLMKAAQEPLTIYLATEKEAITLRHRFYQLRVAMRNEGHPNLILVEAVSITVPQYENGGGWSITLQPQDNKYLDAIRRAGVDISEPTDVPGTVPTVDGVNSAIDKFFGK